LDANVEYASFAVLLFIKVLWG